MSCLMEQEAANGVGRAIGKGVEKMGEAASGQVIADCPAIGPCICVGDGQLFPSPKGLLRSKAFLHCFSL